MIRNLRKWAFLFAAASVAVVGCGGGGNDGGTPNPIEPGIPGTNVAVNLNPDFGRVEVSYLTGQGVGPLAPGDLSAFIDLLILEDQYGQIGSFNQQKQLSLRGFDNEIIGVTVPFAELPTRTRLFEQFTLDLQGVRQESFTPGQFTDFPAPEPVTFASRIRTFPGRTTSVSVVLDDSIIFLDDTGTLTLDVERFRERNGLFTTTDAIRGFLSDYVSFDLAAVPLADRPQFSDGTPAGRLLVSGDNYALATAETGTNGRIEVLTADLQAPISGNFGPASSVGGRPTPGTYSLLQADPTDISGIARVVALQGTWRDYQTVLSGVGAFEFITFPNSRDNESHEIVIIQRNLQTGAIANLYFGFADLATGTFNAFPVGNLDDGDVAGEITGTLTNLSNSIGGATNQPDRVRFGTYAFTGGQTLPAGFPTQGTFVVFRR